MKMFAVVVTGWLAMSGLLMNGTASTGEAQAYDLDNVHSTVLFRVKHLNSTYVWGRFNVMKGSFEFDPEQPEAGEIEVNINARSVDTANRDRDKHLKGPDFFNVKQFPRITFKSTGIKKTDGDRYEVTGDLTLHGVTKSITAEMEWVGTGEMRGMRKGGFEARTTIRRSEFGIDFMPNALGDEITIIAAIEGSAK